MHAFSPRHLQSYMFVFLYMILAYLIRWLNESLYPAQNAWPVHFVRDIGSFDQHVGGVLNLMNLCLRSTLSPKPAFFFSSSTASRDRTSDVICAEDFSYSPSTAGPSGYGRSKWVGEKLCQYAAEHTSISVGVLRMGQLVGDTEK